MVRVRNGRPIIGNRLRAFLVWVVASVLVITLGQPVNVASATDSSPAESASAEMTEQGSGLGIPGQPVDEAEDYGAEDGTASAEVSAESDSWLTGIDGAEDSVNPNLADDLPNIVSLNFQAVAAGICQSGASRSNISGHTGAETDPYLIADVDDLTCMQELVNYSVASASYRTGKYWQFSSFNASGVTSSATLSPIGTATAPFSGYISSAGASATISNLKIEGGDYTGLFGVTEAPFRLQGLALANIAVTGENYLGAIVGASRGSAAIRDCSVSGSVRATGQLAGGLVGQSTGAGTLTLEKVSFAGTVEAEAMLGGLLGAGKQSVAIQQAAVKATISTSGARAGGLVGALDDGGATPQLSIRDALVAGTIAGLSNLGGLVAEVNGNTSASVSRAIIAANITANGLVVSGLLNKTSDAPVSLQAVVNVARRVGSWPTDAYDYSSALVYSSETPTLMTPGSRVYRWLGLSASAEVYRPFADGVQTGSRWRFNGSGVSCSAFSQLNFWTDTASMGLSATNGWDFSTIGNGYLPTLNGHFNNPGPGLPFSCMTTLITDSASLGTIVPWDGSGPRPTVPVYNRPDASVFYFEAPNSDQYLEYRGLPADPSSTYNVFLNDQSLASSQTGAATFTVDGAAGKGDNAVAINFVSSCVGGLPNLRDHDGSQTDPFRITNFTELSCMQSIVNGVTSVTNYRSGRYWQFSSFSAGGATLAPIGTDASPFSGHLVGSGTGAKISDLVISGGPSGAAAGWLGVTESAVLLRNLALDGYTVQGAGVGGGLIGLARGAVSAISVSLSGDVKTSGPATGGLVGQAEGSVTFDRVSFAGMLIGTGAVGGLLGVGRGPTVITSAAVRTGASSPGSRVGGLIGSLGNSGLAAGLLIRDVMVLGAVSGSSWVAGLVGEIDGNVSTTISRAVQAARVEGVGTAIAGLVNKTSHTAIALAGVLNAARVTGGHSAATAAAAAGLVNSLVPPALNQARAFHYSGLSSSDAVYRPFPNGTDSGVSWHFHGDAVGCAHFSEEQFWTDGASLGLNPAAGWDFSGITQGYLPSLNGLSPDPYYCLNTYATDDVNLGVPQPWSGSATEATLSYYDRTDSRVRYFAPADAAPLAVHTVPTSNQPYYSLWLNGALQQSGQSGVTTHSLAPITPWSDNLIRLSFAESHCDSVLPNISGHTGQLGDPFRITTFSELVCMQNLVNGSTSTVGYRNGKYWQWGAFSASGATLSPMGTVSAPFSGYITGHVDGHAVGHGTGDGTASVTDLTVSGGDRVGLLGVTGGPVEIKGLALRDVSVSGANTVGAWVGQAGGALQLTDVSVTGAIWATGNQVGAAVGRADGAVTLTEVSVSGAVWASGTSVGGLVGQTQSSAEFVKAVFDGTVSGSGTLGGLLGGGLLGGGLLGTGSDNLTIRQAAVRVKINVAGSSLGGLVGTLSNGNSRSNFASNFGSNFGSNSVSSLLIADTMVLGFISGHSQVAGFVGRLDGNVSGTISAAVSGVELQAETATVAGLLNQLTNSGLVVKSVLNAARLTGSSAADGYASAAALVYSKESASFTYQQAYHWLGLSASADLYRPFPEGTVSEAGQKLHGNAVNCAHFSDPDFWTESASMGLSAAAGWQFEAIASGYLPALHGHFADVPFSCLNAFATNYPASGSIAPTDGTVTVPTRPVYDQTTTRVLYYSAPAAAQFARYRSFPAHSSLYYAVLVDSATVASGQTGPHTYTLPATAADRVIRIAFDAFQCDTALPNIGQRAGNAAEPYLITGFAELLCMEDLVNSSHASPAYRTGKHWQFSAFSASGATLRPIGTAAQPFSGYIIGSAAGPLADLVILGNNLAGTGLLGVTESPVQFNDFSLSAISVRGSSVVGTLVGQAGGDVSLTNVDVSATVHTSGNVAGGLVGSAGSSATFDSVVFAGSVSAAEQLGGLLGSTFGNLQITQASVRAHLSAAGSKVGGLAGVVDSSAPSPHLLIRDAIVHGSISGQSNLAGLVGELAGTTDATISRSVQAANIFGTGSAIAGLVNQTTTAPLQLSGVLNLARATGTPTASTASTDTPTADSSPSAALVYSAGTPNLTATQAYRWLGLSANSALYQPYTSGTVTETSGQWRQFNGADVSCSDFTHSAFWTDPAALNLSAAAGWSFTGIAQGYLPSLNGTFADQSFSCMTGLFTDSEPSGALAPFDGTNTQASLPYYQRADARAFYFPAAEAAQHRAYRSFPTSDTFYYNIFLNSQLLADQQNGNHTYTIPASAAIADHSLTMNFAHQCFNTLPNIGGHSGQETDPFRITNLAELQCMSDLVNTSTAAIGYRTGKFWQFTSIDASGATLRPIGTAAAPFSGAIVGDGTATVRNLNLLGTHAVGLLGVTESAVQIRNFTLTDVSVSGHSAVGALIGLARGAVSVRDVSVSAQVQAASTRVSGLIAVAQASATLSSVSLAGSVQGAGVLGGLLAVGTDNVTIRGASVNAHLQVTDTPVANPLVTNTAAGGLIGTLTKATASGQTMGQAPASLTITDAVVIGSITGQSQLAGVVAQLKGNISARLVNVVQAAEIRGTGSVISGLVNLVDTSAAADLQLTAVLNLAPVTGSSDPGAFDHSAALVYAAIPPKLHANRAFSWSGLSADHSAYRPFVIGTDTQTNWKFNGSAVSCADFTRSTFWADSASLGLSAAAGWNFDRTASGYVPSLNGHFADQPFHCLTTLLTDAPADGAIAPWDGTATLPTQPFYGQAGNRVFYFAAPEADQTFSYRTLVGSSTSSYSVFLNSATLTAATTGDQTFTVPAESRRADNVLGISFGIECDSAYPNIGQRTGESGMPFLITNFDELQCMSRLVNSSTGAVTYRTGKYWQLSSFSAATTSGSTSSTTLTPIGTAAAPFSGHITGDGSVGDGTATITDLSISGTNYTGLLGVTESSVTIKNLALPGVSVTGTNYVGAWVGLARGTVSLADTTMSGTVQAGGNAVGGLIGRGQGAVRLKNASAAGSVLTVGRTVGGLIGQADRTVTVEGGLFDGLVQGTATLGGLLGSGADTVQISQASVRVKIDTEGAKIGGLIGTLSTANPSSGLLITNAVALGSISGQSHVAGLVGELSGILPDTLLGAAVGTITATISKVISGVNISGSGSAIAGLVNSAGDWSLELTSVLNLARVTGGNSAAVYDGAAALVYSSGTGPIVASQAYRYLGLSASAAVYRPFPTGTVGGTGSNTVQKFHGDDVSCSDFTSTGFWTDSGSMGLSTGAGWNFDAIADGYIPSLNGQLANAPFDCMTVLATDDAASGSIAAWDGTAVRPTVPVFDSTTSGVVYFDAPHAHQYLQYQTTVTGPTHYYNVLLDGLILAGGLSSPHTFTAPYAALGVGAIRDTRAEISFHDPCASVFPAILVGDGSVNSPFPITNYPELVCMQRLVNTSVEPTFRTAQHWQFQSFSASGATLEPIGTAESPFSGTITAVGSATIADLNLAGSGPIGLFGVTESAFALKNVSLANVSVDGTASVAAWVGFASGSVTLTDTSISGTVRASDGLVGGLVGFSQGPVRLQKVSVAGNISTPATIAGGLIGQADRTVTVIDAVFDGVLHASATVGGVLARGRDNIQISQANVRLNISSAGSKLGGLIGSVDTTDTASGNNAAGTFGNTFGVITGNGINAAGTFGNTFAATSGTVPLLRIDNSLVTGSIAGHSQLAGLVADLTGTSRAAITKVIAAVNIQGTGRAIAGLINATGDADLQLQAVLNLARLTGGDGTDVYDQSAALVYSSGTPTLAAAQAYRWLGLSGSAGVYRPFPDGTVSDISSSNSSGNANGNGLGSGNGNGNGLGNGNGNGNGNGSGADSGNASATVVKFHGEDVSCSDFGKVSFWTDSASMGFSATSGWNLGPIGQGYLPALGPSSAKQAFSCMNILTTNRVASGSVVPWNGQSELPTRAFFQRPDARVMLFEAPWSSQFLDYRAEPVGGDDYYAITLNGAVWLGGQQGAAAFAIPSAAGRADNAIGIYFDDAQCDLALANIGGRAGSAEDPFRITNFAELACMKSLVNGSTSTVGYRTGKFWQFSSFSASGATLAPIGTASARFSGTVLAGLGSTATVSDLRVTGGNQAGLLGATELSTTLQNLVFQDLTVSGDNGVGALVGSAYGAVTVLDSTVSAEIWATGYSVGGLVGLAQGPVTFDSIAWAGSVQGTRTLGGLLGAGQQNVRMTKVSVKAAVNANESRAGGLVGTASHTTSGGGSASSLLIADAVVLGQVTGQSHLAGLVGELSGNMTATIANAIAGAPVAGTGSAMAGLINKTAESALSLRGAVNLARVTGSSASGQRDQSAALVYSTATPALTESQAFHWQGVSGVAGMYYPFGPSGPAGKAWKFHGDDVSCSDFFTVDFWTNTTSLNLSTASGWSWARVGEGFIPSLNGTFTAEPFSCMTRLDHSLTEYGTIIPMVSAIAQPTIPVLSNGRSQVYYFDATDAELPRFYQMDTHRSYRVYLNRGLQWAGSGRYDFAMPAALRKTDASLSVGFDTCLDNPVPNIQSHAGTASDPLLIASVADLFCMQDLVNLADAPEGYRTGKHWRFQSFSASGGRIGPVGTEQRPFAGWVSGGVSGGVNEVPGAARISDWTISGQTPSKLLGQGLFGVVEGEVQIRDLTLANVRVAGSDAVGALIGQARTEHLELTRVAAAGSVTGVNGVGGLVGTITNGSSTNTATIQQSAVQVSVVATEGGGGIAGTLAAGGPVTVRNVAVHGAVSAVNQVSGLIGQTSAPLSVFNSVLAGTVSGTGTAVSGFANRLAVTSSLSLTQLLNLGRVTAGPSGTGDTAAIAVATVTDDLTYSGVYRWLGLSSSSESVYRPFPSGAPISAIDPSGAGATDALVNGADVSCSDFASPQFWTDTLGLTAESGWNFSSVPSGYVPAINGQFSDQPFTCMNRIVAPPDWSPISVTADFGSAIWPVADFTASIHYFPANSAPASAIYRFDAAGYAPFDIIHGSAVSRCQVANAENWLLPPAGLRLDATISLRPSVCATPTFSFNLSVSGNNLLLSWTAQNAQSVAVNFSILTNRAGGTPPGMSAAALAYSGTLTAYSWNLGRPFAGTYLIRANGTLSGSGETAPRPIAGTLTWTSFLKAVTPTAAISFPDVFTGAAKTVTYKSGGRLTVSRVSAVNANRLSAIRWLASVGVTAGSQSDRSNRTTYRPQDSVNRGAMAQFLQKLAGFSDAQIAQLYRGKSTKLTDIAPLLKSNPARYYAILWLADTGITAGCNTAGTKFCPANTVNRGAMAEFMRKFAGVAATPAASSPFPDVNPTSKTLKYDGARQSVKVGAISSARMGAINWMRTTGITAGSGAIGGRTAYRPQDSVNRGAMAEFMRKLALLVGSTQ